MSAVDRSSTEQPITDQTAAPSTRRGLSLGSIVLLAGIVLIAIVIGIALARQNAGRPTSGPAPEFSFTTFDGQDFKLSDFRGKVVVLNFWASWCVPCRDEAPELQAAWEQYRSRADVVFLGIAYADNGPKSLAFIEEFGLTYLNAPDLQTRITPQYGVHAVPETFIIDQNGNVAQYIIAGVTQAQLNPVIDRLLGVG